MKQTRKISVRVVLRPGPSGGYRSRASLWRPAPHPTGAGRSGAAGNRQGGCHDQNHRNQISAGLARPGGACGAAARPRLGDAGRGARGRANQAGDDEPLIVIADGLDLLRRARPVRAVGRAGVARRRCPRRDPGAPGHADRDPSQHGGFPGHRPDHRQPLYRTSPSPSPTCRRCRAISPSSTPKAAPAIRCP